MIHTRGDVDDDECLDHHCTWREACSVWRAVWPLLATCAPTFITCMTARTFRVELPTHNHSFVVEIAPESSVHDLKAEIERVCPGQPRPDAQRIIWRGRLLADHEKVAEIRTVR